MPASLVSVKFRGIRSYSPLETNSQKIDFMPLTLIVGANGAGKTSIIEVLKFMISGDEPAHSDCRRNFIHTPKQEDRRFASGETAYACMEIVFKNSFGELCLAKREITRYGTTKNGPPNLSSGYKIGQASWIYVHRQDDWNTVMPKIFGLPNPTILSKVILCHQEDNLWCMGDSVSVKQIYDKIFGCEQYKKEIKHIEDQIRDTKKLLATEEKTSLHTGDIVERKKVTIKRIEVLTEELEKISLEIHQLDRETNVLNQDKKVRSEKLKATEHRSQEVENLKRRVKELMEKDRIFQRQLSSYTYKRPAPIVERQQPVRKKPAVDPTVADLDFVFENFGQMTKLIDKMPVMDEVNELKRLVDLVLERLDRIKERFVNPVEEPPSPPPVAEEPRQEDLFFEQMERNRKETQGFIEENREELKKVRDEIEVIQQQIKADTAIEEAKAELIEVENKMMKVRDNRSMKLGSKSRMELELGQLKRELSTYKDANIKHATSLGKLTCHKLILGDLEKLKTCFLESITNFHEQMIKKINELLRCRWRNIYQGQDIEYIELVAEEVTKGKDKKSYNYHIAMRKNGLIMRMREKSSAGQRALASIIVRMSLAELFVRDFAFIALDEPTANLDLANVQALARSIGAYVRKRTKKGSNIQWIIITHDEQFLRALDEECSPFFYRVKMDPKDKCSRIIKVASDDVSQMDSETTVAA